jgi:hypothetical protein
MTFVVFVTCTGFRGVKVWEILGYLKHHGVTDLSSKDISHWPENPYAKIICSTPDQFCRVVVACQHQSFMRLSDCTTHFMSVRLFKDTPVTPDKQVASLGTPPTKEPL